MAVNDPSLDTSSNAPSVTTDLPDYAPGSTAVITASNFIVGSTIIFQVSHVLDAGSDGQYGTSDDVIDSEANASGDGHEPWSVTDGVRLAGADGVMGTADDQGDLDGLADGKIVTQWFVNPDDSVGATFLLTANDAATGQIATTTFTDAPTDLNAKQHEGQKQTVAAGPDGLLGTSDDVRTPGTYTSGNLTTFFEGDSVNYRFELSSTATTVKSGHIDVQFSQENAANPFFVGNSLTLGQFNYTLGSHDSSAPVLENLSGTATWVVSKVGTATASSGDWFQSLYVTKSGFTVIDGKLDANGDGVVNVSDDGAILGNFGGTAKSVNIIDGALDLDGNGVVNTSDDGTFNRTVGSPITIIDGQFDTSGNGSIGTNDDAAVTTGGSGDARLNYHLTLGDDLIDFTGSSQHSRLSVPSTGAGDFVTSGQQNVPIPANSILINPDISVTKQIDRNGDHDFTDLGDGTATTGEYQFDLYRVTNLGGDGVAGTPDDTRVFVTSGSTNASGQVVFADVGAGTFVVTETQTNFSLGTYAFFDGSVVMTNGGTGGFVNDLAAVTVNVGDPSHVQEAAITFRNNLEIKTLHIEKDATVPGGTADVAGETISYTLAVTNTGNAAIAGVVVTDAFTADEAPVLVGGFNSGDTDTDGKLDVSETWHYTASHVVTQDELDAGGTITNVAVVTGTGATGDDDDATTPVAQTKTLHIEKDATVPGGTADVAGETISYTMAVTNTGNAAIAGVVVTDAFTADEAPVLVGGFNSGDTDTDGKLDVSETWHYTASHVVTQDELDAGGTITNVAVVTGTGATGDDDDATTPVAQTKTLHIEKDATVPGGTADVAGETISYTLAVTNTGNAAIAGVVVSDPFTTDEAPVLSGGFNTGDTDMDNKLDVTETWHYTASHVVTQAELDAGTNIVNTATVTGTDATSDDDDASVPVAQSKILHIEKDATVPGGTADVAGETISYTLAVTNTGNAAIAGVVVSDPFTTDEAPVLSGGFNTGDTDMDNKLDVTETWHYTASHVVTQAELDAGTNIVNTATVTGTDATSDDDDASVPVAQSKILHIEKDATVPGGTADVAGETISYTLAVTNTGNAAIAGVVVSDPFTTDEAPVLSGGFNTGDTDMDNKLDVTETWHYTASHVVTQAELDAGTNIVNTATVTGTDATSDDDDASVPVAQSKILHIEKDATVPGGTADVAGETISYTMAVTNTGNAAIAGVVVSDPFTTDEAPVLSGGFNTGDTDMDNKLDVTETWHYTASHVVTQAELDAGTNIVNTATVTGTDATSDDDDASVPVAQSKILHIEKDATVPGGTADVAGETISYTLAVTNTGNAAIAGVVVSDPFTTDEAPVLSGGFNTGDTDMDNKLDVTETWHYTASHVVTQAELDAGTNIVNTATVTGTDATSDDDDASVPVAQSKILHIEKDATVPGGTADVAGETISYTLAVTNTGNAAIAGVVVSDPFTTDEAPVLSGGFNTGDTDMDNKLDVTETWHYTASHVVTQAELDAGTNIVNTATVTGTDATSDDDDASVPVAQTKTLHIEKDATVPGGTADVAGETISYTLAVTNTGNAAIAGVVVSDPFTTDEAPVLSGGFNTGDTDMDNKLDVTETWHYTASHVVTQAELDAGTNIVNTATVTGTDATSDDDDASVPVAQSKILHIEKDATVPGGTADVAGETISYTLAVTNTGNAAIAGVVVSDPFTTDEAPVLSGGFNTGDTDMDNKLDVTETWHYTASHVVTQAELDAGTNIVNTATVTGTDATSDDDDASVPVAQSKILHIEKDATVPGGTADVAGETISYTMAVTNTGNAAIAGVVVSDPFTTDEAPVLSGGFNTGDTDMDNKLDVTETWHYTASHVVTQAELDAGTNIVNTATVTGTDATSDDDDASVPVAQSKILHIEKDATVPGGTADVAGETISYTLAVTNTGNAAIAGVVVSDPFTTDEAPVLSGGFNTGDTDMDNKLDVTETWHYTASHVVTQAELDAGTNIVNTATVTGTDATSDDDDASVPVAQTKTLHIEKDATVPGGTADVAGETISYTLAVTNIGNAAIAGVVVSDPFTTDEAPVLSGGFNTGDTDMDNKLDVTETWHYTASHVVTQAELDAGTNIVNTATVTGTDATSDDDDASVPVQQRIPEGALGIEKFVRAGFDAVGHPIWDNADVPTGPHLLNEAGNPAFKIVVTNSSNVTALNVMVVDDNGTPGVPGDDFPINLSGVLSDLDSDGVKDDLAPFTSVEAVYNGSWQSGQHTNTAAVTGSIGGHSMNDSDVANYFGDVAGPGVRTPGFWTNTTWQDFWDGDASVPKQASQPNFPHNDILFNVMDKNPSAAGPQVIDPVGGAAKTGLLIGDYNKNGMTDSGEETIFYTIPEALKILNASTTTTSQDARYILDRDLVATWLNFLAGNPIDGPDSNPSMPGNQDPHFYVDQAIDWLQLVTPNENGSTYPAGQGDGYLKGLGTTALDASSPVVPSSSTFWNKGISNSSDSNTALNNYPGGGYNNTFDGPVLAGNAIHTALDEYNNFGTINHVVYATDGDAIV